jgi:hypothetical protein
MPRRAKFAVAAEEWMRKHAPSGTVSSGDLWAGLSKANPELTTPSETRKTPKATCMRDIRKDGAFDVGGGRVGLCKSG